LNTIVKIIYRYEIILDAMGERIVIGDVQV